MRSTVAALISGLVVSMAGTAVAQEGERSEERREEQRKQEEKQAEEKGEKHSISGEVLSVRGSTLYLQTEDGAVVPVQVTRQTQMEGERLPEGRAVESHVRNTFRQGSEIEAEVRMHRAQSGEITNQAVSLKKD